MHTWAWLAWLLAGLVVFSTTRNPLYLGIALLCLALVGLSLPRPENRFARPVALWKLVLLLVGMAAVFNALTSHYGDTRLIRIPGQVPLLSGAVTLEALVYGATNGLVLAGLLAAFWILGQALPVKRLIGLIPRPFYPLAVVTAIAVTYLPATLRQFQAIREAQAVRGHSLRGLRDWLPLFLPLLVGGLERALQLAEAMTARGFASTGQTLQHTPPQAAPRLAMLAGMLAVAAGWVSRLAGWNDRLGWPLLAGGLLLIGAGLWRLGPRFPRSAYHPQAWHVQDTLTLLGALLALAVLLLPLPGMGASALWYTPYPGLAFPPFSPWLGLGLLGLLGPLSQHLVKSEPSGNSAASLAKPLP